MSEERGSELTLFDRIVGVVYGVMPAGTPAPVPVAGGVAAVMLGGAAVLVVVTPL